MLNAVAASIKKYHMLNTGDSVLVGLSGGADSVVLLFVLLELRQKLGLGDIFAAHINHNLRGADAASDENFARKLCADLNIPIKTFQADIQGLAKKERLGTEEAGRKQRYIHLEEAREIFGAQKIALGHNRDDVAETVLMNMCRGAGLRGLCGIPPVNGAVVRPLIDISRCEIEECIKANQLPHITDASNFSAEYTRNRVRNTVIPVIEQNISPQAKAVIARNAAWIRADEDFLEDVAATAFASCVVGDEGSISLDIKSLQCLPEAIVRRVIRQAIAQAKNKNLSDISASHIRAVIDLAYGETGRTAHLPGCVARREYSRVVIGSSSAASGYCYPIELSLPLYIPEIDEIFVLSSSPPDENCPPNHQMPILHCTKAFECDIVEELVLRARQPGDRIVLGGAPGKTFTKKLQDYFTDEKIPRHKRDVIPLVTCGNEIICILDEKGRTSAKYNKKTYWAALWSGEKE